MKWYQSKEQAAGEKRLMLTWYLYNICGKRFVQILACIISFFAFIFSKQIKNYSKKNLSAIFDYTQNNNAKPCLINQYKLVRNYALSLVDRMEVFAGKYNAKKITFENEAAKRDLIEDIKKGHGVFFICTHIGNIEALRAFIESPGNPVNPHVNIFLSDEQCKIFNNFLKKIQKSTNTSTYPVEHISIETGSEIKDKLENGEIVFIAGDRISASAPAKTFSCNFLNKNTEFPSGTFKFAQLMDTQIYFISAVKEKNDTYKVYLKRYKTDIALKKSGDLHKMQKEYVEFLSRMTTLFPLQFYHFYDLFN